MTGPVDIIIVPAGTNVMIPAIPQVIVIPDVDVEILGEARYIDPATGREAGFEVGNFITETRHIITTDWKE